MRLIDADKFEAYSANGTDLEGEEFLAYLSGMQRVLEDIDAAPTIDPEILRPHGRWVCVNAAYGRYECSVCHTADEDCSDYYGEHNVTAQDFCPYCGAKMDGGDNQ